uniref:ACT domain-containing protein n=1 Tax=Panagrellus redivivus TaxID=6233 RepID=A0A7E4VUU8_PANRE
MEEILRMAMLQAGDMLLQQAANLFIVNLDEFGLYQTVEVEGHVFEDELHDIPVIELPQNLYLPNSRNRKSIAIILETNLLQCYRLTTVDINGFVDFTVSAFADWMYNLVLGVVAMAPGIVDTGERAAVSDAKKEQIKTFELINGMKVPNGGACGGINWENSGIGGQVPPNMGGGGNENISGVGAGADSIGGATAAVEPKDGAGDGDGFRIFGVFSRICVPKLTQEIVSRTAKEIDHSCLNHVVSGDQTEEESFLLVLTDESDDMMTRRRTLMDKRPNV